MDRYKLRAIFAGDIGLNARVMFVPAVFDEELYFCIPDDNETRYPFGMVFDDDELWFIHTETGIQDIDGNMIYEKDVIDAELNGVSQNFIVEYINNIAGFGVRTEDKLVIHLYQLKNIRINNASWFKHLLPEGNISD